VERRKIPEAAARAIVVKQCNGVLLPDAELPWDDDDLRVVTQATCSATEAYEGRTMADPLEGIGYGRGKARVMIQYDGAPLIHSFAARQDDVSPALGLMPPRARPSACKQASRPSTCSWLMIAWQISPSIETKQLSTLASSPQWRRQAPDRAGPQGAAQGGRQVEGRRRTDGEDGRAQGPPAAESPHPMPTPERLPVMATVNAGARQAKGGEQPPMRGYDVTSPRRG